MDARTTGQTCNLITLIAAAVRLLPSFFDQWPHGSSWIIATWYGRHGNRILSLSLAIILLCLYSGTTSGKLIDVLSNASVACESLFEMLQTYSFVREADDLPFYLPKRHRDAHEVTIFMSLFVIPSCLCFSPCLPISDRFKLVLFAIPIIIGFCGQLMCNVRCLSVKPLDVVPRQMFVWNISRTGSFGTLLLTFAVVSASGITDIRVQRTFSAVLRMLITVFPTAFFTKQPVRKLLQALRLSEIPNEVEPNSGLEAVTAHASVTALSIEQEDDASISRLVQKKISAQAITVGIAEPAQEDRNRKQFHLPMYNRTSQQNISDKDFVSNTMSTVSARERDQEASVLGA